MRISDWSSDVCSSDLRFKRNWRESREHGILRGAYHYFKPHINGKVQARLFLQTVNQEEGDLPPVLDVEEIGRLTPEKLRERMTQCLKVIEEKTGVKRSEEHTYELHSLMRISYAVFCL